MLKLKIIAYITTFLFRDEQYQSKLNYILVSNKVCMQC